MTGLMMKISELKRELALDVAEAKLEANKRYMMKLNIYRNTCSHKPGPKYNTGIGTEYSFCQLCYQILDEMPK